MYATSCFNYTTLYYISVSSNVLYTVLMFIFIYLHVQTAVEDNYYSKHSHCLIISISFTDNKQHTLILLHKSFSLMACRHWTISHVKNEHVWWMWTHSYMKKVLCIRTYKWFGTFMREVVAAALVICMFVILYLFLHNCLGSSK